MKIPLFRNLACLFLAIIAGLVPFVVSAAPERAEIVDLVLNKSGRDLEVSFNVVNCFTSKMEEAIRNGVPTTFRILVAIDKPAQWPLSRSDVVDFTLEHTIRYNRLNDEYQVLLPEHPEKVLVTQDFDEAKHLMSTVRRLPVIPTCWLRRGPEYTLRAKAELSKVELPFFLRYILFWVSLWDFETDWQKVNFSMQP
jgi:hypothetical protein